LGNIHKGEKSSNPGFNTNFASKFGHLDKKKKKKNGQNSCNINKGEATRESHSKHLTNHRTALEK